MERSSTAGARLVREGVSCLLSILALLGYYGLWRVRAFPALARAGIGGGVDGAAAMTTIGVCLVWLMLTLA